jgi:desulfoferrodoxin (superoxide reductase-like protein)
MVISHQPGSSGMGCGRSKPKMYFQVNKIKGYKSFNALALCNIHGLWEIRWSYDMKR